jgi:hypothetical protein
MIALATRASYTAERATLELAVRRLQPADARDVARWEGEQP